jgi:hypothetical protein
LAKPVVTSVIIGAKWLDQLEENLAAVEVQLTEDELEFARPDERSSPEYPGWMLATHGAGRLGELDRPVWDDMRQSASTA